MKSTNVKEQAAKLSVYSNTALVVGKLSIGVAIDSVGVISEGIHSSLDLLAAIIAFFAVRQASHPADEKHKYGHGKIENLSGTIEGILILIAALWIAFEAMQKFFNPHQVEFIGWGVAIMAVSSIVNFFTSIRYFSRLIISSSRCVYTRLPPRSFFGAKPGITSSQ